jgi:hypothetical protein
VPTRLCLSLLDSTCAVCAPLLNPLGCSRAPGGLCPCLLAAWKRTGPDWRCSQRAASMDRLCNQPAVFSEGRGFHRPVWKQQAPKGVSALRLLRPSWSSANPKGSQMVHLYLADPEPGRSAWCALVRLSCLVSRSSESHWIVASVVLCTLEVGPSGALRTVTKYGSMNAEVEMADCACLALSSCMMI